MPAAVAIPAIVGAAGVGAQVYGAHKAAGAAKDAAKIQSNAAAEVAASARKTAGEAATGVEEAAATANDILKGSYEQAQGTLNPYNQAGQTVLTYLSDLLKPGGGLDEKFSFAFNPEEDPGYQFRMQQGQKALEQSAAMRGSVLSGGTLKSLANYSQGLASQEYGNSFNRALQTFQANQQARGQRLSGLAGLAGMGLSAAGHLVNAGEFYGGQQAGNITDAAARAGQFRMGGEEIAGNAVTGGANAQAAGKVGAANAWNQGISGSINTAKDAILLSRLLSATASESD